MTEDARFEDGGERPLRLKALDADDMPIVAALVQDAVFPLTEMSWDQRERRFAILLNRFRWEDKAAAERGSREFERVQTVMVIDDVMAVRSQGFDRVDKDLVLSILTMSFQPGEDGSGQVEITLAGDGAIRFDVEALGITLHDVTRPYFAPSGHAPDHPE
jgi:hypothetical protein